jgi:DNA-binding transcriptional LysR family regulator
VRHPLVAAGFGVVVVSEPPQKIPAKDVIFRDLAPEDRAWMPVGAVWRPESLTAPVSLRFIDVLTQTCGNGNGGVGVGDGHLHAPGISRKLKNF